MKNVFCVILLIFSCKLYSLTDDEVKFLKACENGKYETADDYFRQVLEMDGDDQEAKFMRYIVGVCEKNDYWTQTFEKQLIF